MPDSAITPVLTPEEFASLHAGTLSEISLAGIADILTNERLSVLREALLHAEGVVAPWDTAHAFLDALASYLPPER